MMRSVNKGKIIIKLTNQLKYQVMDSVYPLSHYTHSRKLDLNRDLEYSSRRIIRELFLSIVSIRQFLITETKSKSYF